MAGAVFPAISQSHHVQGCSSEGGFMKFIKGWLLEHQRVDGLSAL